MSVYIVLLRAVNVGGTGKLPMAELTAMCLEVGFSKAQTYIASGNVVVETDLPTAKVKSLLEARLNDYAGRPVGVVVRSVKEMATVLKSNPFPKAAPNRTVVIFLHEALPANALESISGKKDEELAMTEREIYVYYGQGMADSKLKIPAAKNGTGRNMNTVAKLIELAQKMQDGG